MNTTHARHPHALQLADIIATTARLGEILNEETGLLKTRRFKEIEVLQEEKGQLIELLEQLKSRARNGQVSYQGDSKEDREDFGRLVGAMDDVMREHYYELTKARDINRILVEAISFAVAEELAKGRRYGAKGSEETFSAKRNAAVALTVDKKI